MSNTKDVPSDPLGKVLSSVRDSEKLEDLHQDWVDHTKHPDAILTTNWGLKIADDDSTMRAGPRGPLLLQDIHFREKIFHFDHERIPERVVHARGTAAHGYFQAYSNNGMEKHTFAKTLIDSSRITPTFVRFSTVLGFRGSSDTVRDVRGFATRFYTPEGNWDIVGNNMPIFFIQDPLKFPDLIHSGKPHPHNEIPQAQTAHDNFWDYMSLQPEATHMIMWVLSDRAIPRSFSMMQGFGVNTFRFINSEGESSFVKFHWRPVLGVHSLAWDEALKISGYDPDFHRRDLYEAIEKGKYPEWELGVQIVPEAHEDQFDFDLLDDTKIIPEELVPVKYIGKMVLNRNVSEFFTETEQVAFCTQNIIPGIDFSDDPMLQGRNFSYLDTQLSRLGTPNFMELPINRPMCPVFNHQRDGAARHTIVPSKVNYYPNRYMFTKPDNAPSDLSGFRKSHTSAEETAAGYQEGVGRAQKHKMYVGVQEKLEGMKTRMRGPKFQEHYNQARLFYYSLSDVERDHLKQAAAFELGRCDDLGVRQRIVARFSRVDTDLAQYVADKIGVALCKEDETGQHFKAGSESSHGVDTLTRATYGGTISPALSQLNTVNDVIQGRKIALLIADGYDAEPLAALKSSLSAAGAFPIVVSTRKGAIFSSAVKVKRTATGEERESSDGINVSNAQFSVFTSRSVLFDAVVVPGGSDAVETLVKIGEAIGFVAEACKHYKAIFAIGEGIQLLKAAHLHELVPGLQLASPDAGLNPVDSLGIVTVAKWNNNSDEKTSGTSHVVGSALSAISGAISGSIGKSAGADVLVAVSDFVGNKSTSLFVNHVAKHRYWTRDTLGVSA